jgi:hypothetical protein
VTKSEQYVTESAVLASEIEQLADGAAFIKFASQPEWIKVQFPDVSQEKVAPAFQPRRWALIPNGRRRTSSNTWPPWTARPTSALKTPLRVLLAKDCVDPYRTLGASLDYFNRHRPGR